MSVTGGDELDPHLGKEVDLRRHEEGVVLDLLKTQLPVVIVAPGVESSFFGQCECTLGAEIYILDLHQTEIEPLQLFENVGVFNILALTENTESAFTSSEDLLAFVIVFVDHLNKCY